MNSMKTILGKQKEFFFNNNTIDINFRLENLKKLKRVLKDNEDVLLKALKRIWENLILRDMLQSLEWFMKR